MSYIGAVVDSVWFGKQIRSVQARVDRLHRKVQRARRSEPRLEEEARRCMARLQKLLDYANRNPVLSASDQRVAEETLSKLKQTERLLIARRPLWQRFLGWIAQAIDFVIRLLQVIRPIVPILPPSVRERLIALLGTFDAVIGLLPPAK